MTGRTLLLYNTPKARRYFRALERGLPAGRLRVEPLLVATPSRGQGPHQPRAEAIADYSIRRKTARTRIPAWRQRLLAEGLVRAACAHYAWTRRRLARLRPDAVGVWGGQAVDVRAARAACEDTGVPCFVFETGLLPGTTTCDPRGVNQDNSVPRDPAFYARYPHRGPLPRKLQPRASRRRADPAALPDDYVFVPFQVRLDSQLLLYSPWIRDMRHLLDVVAEAHRSAFPDGGPALVFKRHPSCRERHRDLGHAEARHRGLHFADGNDTEALIRGARGVVTVNSTVGVEALLLGQPVLTLGQACYAIPGVADHADRVDTVAGWLRTLTDRTLPDPVHREAFLNYLARDYCIPGHHKAVNEAHCAAVAHRLSGGSSLVPLGRDAEGGVPVADYAAV